MDSQRNTSALFARASRNSERVIVPINDSALGGTTQTPAFYCVHDVTGGALSDFVELARRLDTATRFYGIQTSPKKMLETDFGASIKSLATYYVEKLTGFQPQGPFMVGGFCAGAIIALEIAQQLRASGREVNLLVAIDAAPENTFADRQPWHPAYWVELVRNLPGWVSHGGFGKEKHSHTLIRRFWNNLIALGKAAMGRHRSQKMSGGYAIDSDMSLSQFPPAQRLFINRLFSACFEYSPANYPGDVVVYEAKVKPLFHLPQLASRWRGIAAQSQLVCISGTHLSMMRAPFVDEIATDMRNRIVYYCSQYPPMDAAP